MKVTRDRRGTFPRTVTYTVEDPDGYNYTVGNFDGKLTCFVHGVDCVHAMEVKQAIEQKKVKP